MTTLASRKVYRADAPLDSNRYRELHVLQRLWSKHSERAAQSDKTVEGCDYLRAHFGMQITLERHLRAIDLMAGYVRGRVLEWGCRHGLDSCVYRLRFGQQVELHGCDVCAPDEYAAFHSFSGLRYQRIEHPYRLDYDDDSFDVVTSNGVLEHVPDPERSLGEIHRVLRAGGVFLITCLPNKFSYTEAIQRWRGATSHDRLYTLGSTKRLLRAAGFEVADARRFFMVPTMLNGFPEAIRLRYQRRNRLVWSANDALERIWPLNLFASNLMVTAFKP